MYPTFPSAKEKKSTTSLNPRKRKIFWGIPLEAGRGFSLQSRASTTRVPTLPFFYIDRGSYFYSQMLPYLSVFLTGLFFSFIGSIPPGTLNVSVLQLGLQKKVNTALRFALAVSIIEYPYAWIAVEFESWLTSTPVIIANFQLITAILMTTLGIYTIWSSRKPSTFSVKFSESGFRRGIVLSLVNPMAIPYWMGATAYFKAQGWVDLSSPGLVHSYVLGTSVGAMALLTIFVFMANRLAKHVQQNLFFKMLPGIIMLALGLYAFVRYFFF